MGTPSRQVAENATDTSRHPVAPPCVPTWKLPNGFSSADVANDAALPRTFGTQQVSYQSLGTESALFHARVKLKDVVHVSTKIASESPVAMLRLPRAGQVKVCMTGCDPLVEHPEAYGFFLHGDIGAPVDLMHQPGQHCETVALMISQERLSSLLAGMRLPNEIDEFLAGSTENKGFSVKISMLIRGLSSQLIASPYDGDLAKLYLNGILLKTLAAILSDLNGSSDATPRPHQGEHAKVAMAIDLLQSDLAHPPTMETLARTVGLTQRRLAELFKAKTGMTIVEWLVGRKIEQAAALLRQGDQSIKEIAYCLGYAQVGTFTSQFTRRVGLPPAQFRRSVHTFIASSCKSS